MVDVAACCGGVHLIHAAALNIKDKRTWRATRCREGVSELRGNLHGQALEVCGSSRAAKRGLQDYTDGAPLNN